MFCGTPGFAVPSLRRLTSSGYAPVAVLTAPDRPRGRGLVPAPPAVKSAALGLGLAVHQPPSPKDPSFLPLLQSLHPDLLVVVAFRILPAPVLALPGRGAINLHASLLPKYRGAAPINWAIISGEKETGVTTFFLEEHVDTGALIYQERTPIGDEEDAGSLHDRLADLGAEVVERSVRAIEQGTAPRVPQDPGGATPAPRIFREDCRIAWDVPSERVRNFIRGLAPVPGAFTTHRGRQLKLYRAERRSTSPALPPGAVRVEGGELLVGTADVPLSVRELQQETKRRMDAEDFLRGYPFRPGERFE